MALTVGQKSIRVLVFLRGLNRPEVLEALRTHGFSQRELLKGWRLLYRSTEHKLARRKPYHHTMRPLSAWEGRWLPIARAALEHNYPEFCERLFLNLGRTTGIQVAISISVFVCRIRAEQEAPNQEAKAALALLVERGLTEEVLTEAEELLTALETIDDREYVSDEGRLTAEKAVWNWYLEWSTIARHSITNRNLLRGLGFLRNGSPASVDEEQDDVEVALISRGPQSATA